MSFTYVGIPLLPPECHNAREYKNGALKVFVSQDSDEKMWHLSISHPHRYPTWDEIHGARLGQALKSPPEGGKK